MEERGEICSSVTRTISSNTLHRYASDALVWLEDIELQEGLRSVCNWRSSFAPDPSISPTRPGVVVVMMMAVSLLSFLRDAAFYADMPSTARD